VTDLSIAFEELLHKSGVRVADFLREAVQVLCQALVELEVSQKVGAERYAAYDVSQRLSDSAVGDSGRSGKLAHSQTPRGSVFSEPA